NLTMDHIGNQLTKVTDAVANFVYIESADFKDYSNAATEYTYNRNGAMSQDLNKGISQIQYNSLNLPRMVDIKNKTTEGRNEYTYSASGQKLKAVQKWNPNYSTSPVIGSTINTAALTQSQTTDYVGNIIYENNALKRILVDGGYNESGNYYFYINDHLGNNRIVTDAAASVVQSTQYYPFGSSFADASGTSAQPYKYNGKELDARNGLNMYDYSARWKDDFRFTTVDPLAESYYSWSPYAYVMNNPLRYIDPDGCSTHTDSLGHVVAVYNDDNMGVFKHGISADTYDGNKLLAKNGTNMGETEYWDEFLDLENENSNVVGTIKFGESWDDIIAEKAAQAKDMNIKDIAMGSKPGGTFDVKKDYPNGEGRLLNGKYATARSAGNYLAGYNASQSGNVPGGFATFQKLAGAVHVKQRAFSKWDAVNVVIFRNTYGPAPYYGEIYYQYRRSLAGWKDAKKK
ncbi:RHS repeat domain-containing protein, partial [Dysgonomonas reticulitermitis]